ncbi:MAG: phage tail protein [Oscillospiraceae bacterium]|nr:phage tail protein [Oscillospiraceae bacterium]
MPQLYTDTGQRVGVLTGRRKLHVKHALEYDEKTLHFEYPVAGPYAAHLVNEAYVRTKKDEFVIKQVDGESTNGWITVTATMNIEGIEGCLFVGGFEVVEETVDVVLTKALADSDWTVGVCEITKKRTIRKEEDCNAWDVLKQCVSTYRCEVEIDTLKHVINIYAARGVDRGVHFMEGVNLTKLSYSRDTYEFFTQIIPVGKNGMTLLDDPDDPVLILSNHTFSKKKVRRIWRDERYTNVKSLREDALAKLAEACKPLSSYTGTVRELAKGSTAHPDFFDYGIGDTIHLVSKSTGIRERQRIVMVDEYENTQDNQVEINNVAKTFAQMQRDEAEVATETAARLANGYTDAQLEDYATTEEVDVTVTQVTETELKKYATKDELTAATNYAATLAQEAQEGAEATAAELANTAERNAKRSTQEALTSYWTSDETEERIQEAMTEQGTTVAGQYAEKTEVEAVRVDAETALLTAEAAMEAAMDKETGSASTDETGVAAVQLSAEFAAAAVDGFRVWLQAMGPGEIYVSESDTTGFRVAGAASLPFVWLAIRITTTQGDQTDPAE